MVISKASAFYSYFSCHKARRSQNSLAKFLKFYNFLINWPESENHWPVDSRSTAYNLLASEIYCEKNQMFADRDRSQASHTSDPFSFFSFQLGFNKWCKKDPGMYYPVYPAYKRLLAGFLFQCLGGDGGDS